MNILLIEDNRTLAKSLERVLKQEGHTVEYAWNGTDGLHLWRTRADHLDLVISDVMLPYLDGLSLCKTIREENIQTPVLFLSALGETHQRVEGLRSGGDDYLIKPFSMDELLARVDALLRRPRARVPDLLALGTDITLSLENNSVTLAGKEVLLTPMEFRILAYLAQHKNMTCTRGQLLENCFEHSKDQWSNSLEVHIKNLRRKLFSKQHACSLQTVRGIGYKMATE